MKWQIEYLEKERIISAIASGPTSVEDYLKSAKELFACAHKNNTNKIIVDFTKIEPVLNVLQIEDLSGILEQAGFTPDIKMSLLFDFSSPFKNNFQFFNNLAFLKAFKIKSFDDKKNALRWLNENRQEHTSQKPHSK